MNKVMWWGLKRILSSRSRDTHKSAKNQNPRQVVWKQVSFQDCKKKIHQTFLASKYEVKLPFDAT